MRELHIFLNMSEYALTEFWIYLGFLMSTCWDIEAYSEPGQRSKTECFGKIIMFLTIFAKNTMLNFERVLNICSVLKMSEFWIFVIFRKYEFWMCVGVHLWKGYEYCRIPLMPGLYICTSGTRLLIWLNNALWQGSEYACSTFHRVLNKPLVLNMP